MFNFKRAVIKICLLIFLLVSVLMVFFVFSDKSSHSLTEKPLAKKGVLDLRNWDFKDNGIIGLNGEWEFYYGKLLTPEDFQGEELPKMDGFIDIPGNFNGYIINGQPVGGQGFATFRLRVITDKAEELYGIKTEYIETAHKLWANGRVVSEAGKIGKLKNEMTAALIPKIGVFACGNGEFDIILQVSNFYTYQSQVDTILMGTDSQIITNRTEKVGFDLFLLGSTIIAAVYHLGLFFRRRKDKAPLYFALVCAIVALRTALVGERLIHNVFKNMNFILNGWLLNWTWFLYIPILVLFINKYYEGLLSKFIVRLSSLTGIIYFFTILLSPIRYQYYLVPPFEIVTNIVLIYILSKMIYRYIKGEKGYEIAFIGILALFITRFNDLLYHFSIIITGSYAPLGMLIFIAAQSYVTADRFSMVFSSVEEMTEKLKSVDKLKDDFLASTSHELRTPLNGIIGLTESLVSGMSSGLTDEQKETLDLVQASARRLSNLVNDILDFSKLKNNDLNLERKPVDLRAQVQIVIKFCEATTKGRDLVIINNIPQSFPYAYGDENRIQQILYNLIGNAVKFTPKGIIEIQAEEKEENIHVYVRDTGIGIPQDKLDIIFEAYEQGKGIGERYGGTGLGLYVTRHLVKLHGGDISVRSEEGKGTEFVFSLPKCCTYADTSHSISEMQKTKQDILCKENILPKTIPLIQKKILIVDDELVNRKVLKNFLEHEGYTVITASNGKEALEIIDNNELDLVILDMMLPDIIGYEICRALRETKSLVELPVLIMTADIRPEMVVISFECGANDYLRKPFNRSELMARVKTLISLKNSVNEILTLQKEVAAASNEVAALNENIKENEKVLTEMIEYDKLKTEFFANISHELRTPLNVIWSSIQLLQHIASQGTDAGSISKYLKIMNQNTLRLLRLINNLIDSTKINGGYLSLELSNENIVSVIEEIVLSSVVYAESKGINLIFDTEIEEKYIAVDIEKIERIILNLLSNAVKFTDRNGSIYVNLYDLKDRIRISVKDTGIGIPEKELERIFERFSQVDKSLSRRAEGSGIGLSLVKTFVEMHNGTIRVKSKLHEGSEFIIELPVIQLEGSSGLIEDSSAQFYTSKYMERVHLEFSDI